MHLAQELGITGLPYFNLHAGHKVQAFAANLSKIGARGFRALLPASRLHGATALLPIPFNISIMSIKHLCVPCRPVAH